MGSQHRCRSRRGGMGGKSPATFPTKTGLAPCTRAAMIPTPPPSRVAKLKRMYVAAVACSMSMSPHPRGLVSSLIAVAVPVRGWLCCHGDVCMESTCLEPSSRPLTFVASASQQRPKWFTSQRATFLFACNRCCRSPCKCKKRPHSAAVAAWWMEPRPAYTPGRGASIQTA